MLSHTLSMIPDWEKALDHAVGLLAPGGALHMVGFGDLQGLPSLFQTLLRGWLAKFHVKHSTDSPAAAGDIAAACGLRLTSRPASTAIPRCTC